MTAGALVCIIIIVLVILISDASARSSRSSKPKQTVRCPWCGSPAEVKGDYWECGWCGDSGRIKNHRDQAAQTSAKQEKTGDMNAENRKNI